MSSDTLFDVRRAQIADDHPSWHGSWERLSDKVHAYLKRTFGRARLPHDVELDDLFSSVLACMLRDLPGLEVKTREEFWGWVRKITAHQVVSFWRRYHAQRRGGGQVPVQQTDEEDVDLLQSTRDPQAHTASVIMRVHKLEDAEEDCVSRLAGEEGKDVYLLRRRWGLSFEEIASQLGRESAQVVRANFYRVKAKVLECLRRKLDDGYGDLVVDS